MGGSGSGGWYRWDKKSTTESQHRIDIRWLKKQNYLNPGVSGPLSWSSRGEQTGAISFRMKENSMILNYRHKPREGEWEDVEQNTYLLTGHPAIMADTGNGFFVPGAGSVWPFYMGLENISFVGIATNLPMIRVILPTFSGYLIKPINLKKN